MSKSAKSQKSVQVSASVDGIAVDAKIVKPWVCKAQFIEPELGERVKSQSAIVRASALEFGRLLLQAEQITDISTFGIVNWLRYWGVSDASKASVSNAIRLAKSVVACESNGLPPIGDRVSRILASACKENRDANTGASQRLESATKAQIQSAIIECQKRADDAKESAKQSERESATIDSKPTGDTSKSNASADPIDFVKNWKSEAMSFILSADQFQLVHLMQVCSTLIEASDGRLTPDSRKSMIPSTVKSTKESKAK